ncbi:hypothetical protein C7212DRAFT_365777 [Tuber magnatum]|uniref:BTB domain-containing protein n=1 Tax=Tuber magnatum TaxID=42249 RepID=A0A317SJE5_9PEZI|nr:hypothetical protein C7212DRAFT_365777 [Tuber magnatum]
MLTRPEYLSETALSSHLLQDHSDIRAKNPLDESEPFQKLCEACRRGDLKTVQNLIAFEGVNLNAVDRFDNLPLTLYSKTIDPAQPWAAHITSLLSREPLDTTDIVITATTTVGLQMAFHLHRFMLSARSPYFQRKLSLPSTPTTDEHKPKKTIRLSQDFSSRAFETVVKYIYLGEVSAGPNSDEDVMANIEKLSRHLEIPQLWELLLADTPKRRRQLRSEGLKGAQAGMEEWVRGNVLKKRIVTCSSAPTSRTGTTPGQRARTQRGKRKKRKTTLYTYTQPTNPFSAPNSSHQCSRPPSSKACRQPPPPPPLQHSLSLLYTSDILLLDRLKSKCAQVIATAPDDLPFHIHDVIRAAWATRVPRLEAFGAKYIAERLEGFLPDPEFTELVAESAGRIKGRQETDTIELVDDIRYYLDQRFRMRVEDNLGFCGNGEEAGGEVDGSLETEKGHVYEELLGRIDALLEDLKLDA